MPAGKHQEVRPVSSHPWTARACRVRVRVSRLAL